jgi:hypothetical protein
MIGSLVVTEQGEGELLRAYRLLYEIRGALAADRLVGLTVADLKSTFRRRALGTHPDRASLLDQDPTLLGQRFAAVHAAYRTLSAHLSRNAPVLEPGPTPSRPRRRQPGYGGPETSQAEPRRRSATDHYYQGPLPGRPLLLGEYLYFSGLVPFGVLVDAICWQRRQRPLIGQLAVQLDILTPEAVSEILALRRRNGRAGDRFVRFARAAGYLTPYHRAVLLGGQRRLQRPIGEYFVERGLLGRADLGRLASQAWAHSFRFGPPL